MYMYVYVCKCLDYVQCGKPGINDVQHQKYSHLCPKLPKSGWFDPHVVGAVPIYLMW